MNAYTAVLLMMILSLTGMAALPERAEAADEFTSFGGGFAVTGQMDEGGFDVTGHLDEVSYSPVIYDASNGFHQICHRRRRREGPDSCLPGHQL